MAPVLADHPFHLIPTPVSKLAEGEKVSVCQCEIGSLCPSRLETIHPTDAPRQPDLYCEAASEMALVHNMMIRGLNAIYLQAPHITAKDENAFSRFILYWYQLLHVHHSGEETDFFPHIEQLTGVAGLMGNNVAQHEVFHAGVDALRDFAQAVADKQAPYDGARVVTLIDAFGAALAQHLTDEIPTIEGLRDHNEKLGVELPKLMAAEAEKNMKRLGLATGLVWCFASLDLRYEDGRWASWPPAPLPVKIICRHIAWWLHTDVWKFAACDRMGNMKPLYAVPASKA